MSHSDGGNGNQNDDSNEQRKRIQMDGCHNDEKERRLSEDRLLCFHSIPFIPESEMTGQGLASRLVYAFLMGLFLSVTHFERLWAGVCIPCNE